ncbi:MAG: nitrate reductase molybdenum cofactor assembly chaperone [Neomegalonema sp.]|nr:nitrate reductase molybdenum cofactor assembly chaperone [Neomegalonema sp.]
MLRCLKACSLLLSYPTSELQQAIGLIREVFEGEPRLSKGARRAIEPLLAEIESSDLYDLEERYVSLFDRSRTLSLSLFEHVHGESRDRGGAMVDLLETYRAGGLEPSGIELPDYLPTLLEFLSTRSEAEARATLADATHILEALNIRLSRRGSSYASIFAALVGFAGVRPKAEAVAAVMSEAEIDPDDLEALDAVWEEAEVRFGPDPNAGCPASRDALARMDPALRDLPAKGGFDA